MLNARLCLRAMDGARGSARYNTAVPVPVTKHPSQYRASRVTPNARTVTLPIATRWHPGVASPERRVARCRWQRVLRGLERERRTCLSDRTYKGPSDLHKRCISDNGWTFGDGFQTLTTNSKPFQDRGFRMPVGSRAAPLNAPRDPRRRTARTLRLLFQTPLPRQHSRHPSYTAITAPPWRRRQPVRSNDGSRRPMSKRCVSALPVAHPSTSWPGPTTSTARRSSRISTRRACPADES